VDVDSLRRSCWRRERDSPSGCKLLIPLSLFHILAEREGFEPSNTLRRYALSKRAHSATMRSLRAERVAPPFASPSGVCFGFRNVLAFPQSVQSLRSLDQLGGTFLLHPSHPIWFAHIASLVCCGFSYFLFFATSFLSWTLNLDGFFTKVRAALVLIFMRSFCPDTGSVIVFFEIFGLKRRFVLRWEWLMLCPV
jgi:hypothetical protein